MKIIVLGCGNIGSVIATDLAQSLPSTEIVMADAVESRAETAASKIDRDNVSWVSADASNRRELINTLKKFDLAVGALPGSMGFEACRAAIAAGISIVDVSYMPEDIMVLNEAALKAKVSVVPDCGMSPGLSNIMIGHAVRQLDKVESVHILNGGLPEKPIPPLGYVITWSVKDLIDMYSRKVTIVREGKPAKVEAMSGLEEIKFSDVGRLEAFYTDGLRTLLHTVKPVEEMWEKTLRYPGHINSIRLLKSLGLFDPTPLDVNGSMVSPRDVTASLLEKKLKRPDVPDIVAMLIRVVGAKRGVKSAFEFHVFDKYDKKRKVTAMARTTAYTASVTTQLVTDTSVDLLGIVPPERLGMNEAFYRKFVAAIGKRGINVEEAKT